MDDDESILRMISRILTSMGYAVETSTDGTEAVQVFREAREAGVCFDLVILDLTVPGGMGGAKTLAELLKLDPAVRAVVSSGYSNDPIMATFGDNGFSGVLPKPYTRDSLAELLQKFMPSS
jgi:CheY-like chemotaxis protein